MNAHIVIEAIVPNVDAGAYPVKRRVGDILVVRADIFRDSHDKLRAQLLIKMPGVAAWDASPMVHYDNDSWRGETALTQQGDAQYCICAWTDVYGTWLAQLQKKVAAGMQVPVEVACGAALVEEALAHAHISVADKTLLEATGRQLLGCCHEPQQAFALAHLPQVVDAMYRCAPRDDRRQSATFQLTVDRERAVFGAWYEMFPRSQGSEVGQACSLKQAARRLADIAHMGFDVVYLPPIHPIGVTHRKGPNNSLLASPQDPGCPWAIGSSAGGHEAVDPTLGTLADFDGFVAAAAAQNLEIALDYAIQCSPDHPWVKQHPEWFFFNPDGSIKYAENPPKKYEDVYPINFDTLDRDGLWSALLHILMFWVQRGVRIFRVDNPHTKPFEFWEWAISTVRSKYPDVLFLAEAFTRPKVMKFLAKIGFNQSYTYFTWRDHGAEIIEYVNELAYSGMQDYYRPNFFVNTPDILPQILQTGGRAACKMRLLLAATLSPTYGIYSGLELCETVPLSAGKEEYLNSEKYEIRVRDWNAPGNIKEWIRQINTIRREHSALQRLDNITFLPCDNPQLLCYGKKDRENILIVVVNLDPQAPHHGTVTVSEDFLGVPATGGYEVMDLLSQAVYVWAQHNYVRLIPDVQPAHILQVRLQQQP